MTLRAIGAAACAPKPPFSTSTASAIVGLSAGAYGDEPRVVAQPLVDFVLGVLLALRARTPARCRSCRRSRISRRRTPRALVPSLLTPTSAFLTIARCSGFNGRAVYAEIAARSRASRRSSAFCTVLTRCGW